MRATAPVVVKFGGESLAQPGLVIARVRALRRAGVPVVVIASARAGVTDLLKELGRSPTARRRLERDLRRLSELHPGLDAVGRRRLTEVRRLARQAIRAGRLTPAQTDALLSQGERLAVHWLAPVLRSAGIPAEPVEADRLGLLTDGTAGAARILLAASERRVTRGLGRVLARRAVPVVTGFFGGTRQGGVATLGRGGSDYTASAIGALLRARRVELVKGHVAISTADPRLVPEARVVSRLSYEEAEEIAQFGARVLHPVTIEPARERRVPIYVRSLNDHPLLTVIGPARPGPRSRAVTLLAPLRLVSLRIAGGRQRPGLIATITRGMEASHVNLAAVVTTEAVLGLLVEPADARRATQVLSDVARATGAVVGQPIPVALVSAVGEGILGEIHRLPRGYLPRAEGLLATARSISFLIREESAVSVLRELHRRFVHPRPTRGRS